MLYNLDAHRKMQSHSNATHKYEHMTRCRPTVVANSIFISMRKKGNASPAFVGMNFIDPEM